MKPSPIAAAASDAKVRVAYRRLLRGRGIPNDTLLRLHTAEELRYLALLTKGNDMQTTEGGHRRITTDDIWGAVRGLALFAKDDHDLQRIRATHARSELFASKVIVRAVDEVRSAQRAIRPRHPATTIGE